MEEKMEEKMGENAGEGVWRVVCEDGATRALRVERCGRGALWAAEYPPADVSAVGPTPRVVVMAMARRAAWVPLEILAPGEKSRAELKAEGAREAAIPLDLDAALSAARRAGARGGQPVIAGRSRSVLDACETINGWSSGSSDETEEHAADAARHIRERLAEWAPSFNGDSEREIAHQSYDNAVRALCNAALRVYETRAAERAHANAAWEAR